jgi:hypothetical protein
MPRGFRVVLLIACAVGLMPGWAAAQTAQQVYAIVVDGDGYPVRGLSAEDFSLRDGSVRQAVLGAEPATNPVWLAVVVQGFKTADLPQVRAAIEAIASTTRKGPAGSHIGVMRPASATSSWRDLASGLSDADWQSLADSPAPPVLDAISQAAVALRQAPTDRRAIVLLIKRSPVNNFVVSQGLLTDQLFNAGAALWTVEVASSSGSGAGAAGASASNSVKLDDLFSDATKFSGSLREPVADTPGMVPMAERVANLILAQYVVAYLWPNPMLSTFSIATRHDRGDVLVPAWAR